MKKIESMTNENIKATSGYDEKSQIKIMTEI
jgi:hypothetical protein